METYRQVVGFTFVIMLGDNIYGGDHPQDFVRKFEQPYKPLLDVGVKFYASLGNHDSPNESQYKLFNMDGDRYYSFKKNDVAFFVLDSTYMSPQQLTWLEDQLQKANSEDLLLPPSSLFRRKISRTRPGSAVSANPIVPEVRC
jgi:hypothetical protein